jgi:hypothetical protein
MEEPGVEGPVEEAVLTSQTKPGPNMEAAVRVSSRRRVSMEEKEAESWRSRDSGMGLGAGVRARKKKCVLWAMEAWLKTGARSGSRAVAWRICLVSRFSSSVPEEIS